MRVCVGIAVLRPAFSQSKRIVAALRKRWHRLHYAWGATFHSRALPAGNRIPAPRILVSVLLPVYRAPTRYLRKAVQSVILQSYRHWELCIVDDSSGVPRLSALIKRFREKDGRIKVCFREKNGGISESSNDALALASGDYVVLLDHDDVLERDALWEVASLLEANPDLDFIYTDEDKIGAHGFHHSPYLKPDWSPDLLLSRMYTCHLGCYRTEILRRIGGFRKEYDGSQDYDMVLRFTEMPVRVGHIGRVLYHWRAIEGSTAKAASGKKYANHAALKAVQSALDRREEGGRAFPVGENAGYFRVQYPVTTGTTISIVIPTRDNLVLLDKCLTSLYERSAFRSFEVVLVDNGTEPETVAPFLRRWKEREPDRFHFDVQRIPFNFSRLCNRGAELARGDILLFLNNDTDVIVPEWLEWMAGFACRESVGAVGAMLLYADDTIQHAGIVLGVKGIANHHHQGYPVHSAGNNIGQLLSQTNYSAVTGACLMVKRSDFSAVGGFEEELAVAFNDVDFCLKLLQMGRQNIFLPEARLRHFESKSRGPDVDPEHVVRLKRESDWMMKKWGHLIRNDPFYNPNLTRDRLDYTPDPRMWKL